MSEKKDMTTTPHSQAHLHLWITCRKEGNPLKHFMAWRKRWGKTGNFAYAQMDTTLHIGLSVMDNFLLAMGEAPSEVPEGEKMSLVTAALERFHLGTLAHWFQLEQRPTNLTPQQKALASICCALLHGAEETLLDLGGMSLDALSFQQLRQVLLKNERMITVITRDAAAWSDTPVQHFTPHVAAVVIKKAV